MAKIIHNKSKCIGCGSCVALCPKFFEMGEEGTAHLKGAKINSETQNEELEIEEPDCAQDAAKICPAQCIVVEK
ncbi:ferredoxin [bacterium]|nr:ferredoxin [bacterium]